MNELVRGVLSADRQWKAGHPPRGYDVEKETGRLLASDYPYKEWIAERRRKGSYVPRPEIG